MPVVEAKPDIRESVEAAKAPDKFRPPHTRITPQQVIAMVNDNYAGVRLELTPDGSSAGVQADAIVSWGGALKLHGTHMPIKEFTDFFRAEHPPGAMGEEWLAGNAEPRDHPYVVISTKGELVRVNVFAGMACEPARTLSDIGSSGVSADDKRQAYQEALYKVYAPIALRPRRYTRAALQLRSTGRILHENEDCIATGDTLAGVGLLIEKLRKQGPFPIAGRRIDVAVATLQGLTLLIAEAHRYGLPTEVNVGFIATGLSYGIGPDLAHKNYIMHGPGELRDFGDSLFVVGDMGDAAKKVGGTPWDDFRTDGYLDGGAPPEDEYASSNFLKNPGSVSMGYANGGLVMEAMSLAALHGAGMRRDKPVIMAVAKRIELPGGFGMRVAHFRGPLQEYCGGH